MYTDCISLLLAYRLAYHGMAVAKIIVDIVMVKEHAMVISTLNFIANTGLEKRKRLTLIIYKRG